MNNLKSRKFEDYFMRNHYGWGALFTFWAKCYKIFNVGIN